MQLKLVFGYDLEPTLELYNLRLRWCSKVHIHTMQGGHQSVLHGNTNYSGRLSMEY